MRQIRHLMEPLVMLYNPNDGSQMSIRLTAADVRQTLASIEQTWTTLFRGYPFEYSFLSDCRHHRSRSGEENRIGGCRFGPGSYAYVTHVAELRSGVMVGERV